MNKAVFLLFFFISCAGISTAQQPAVAAATDTAGPYGKAYHKAQFCGGEDSLRAYIKRKIHYPDAAKENYIEGRVMVRFLLDEYGRISHVQVVRGIDSHCDTAAKKMVEAMPSWQAAVYKNRTMRSVEVLPVVFKLE